MMKLAVHLLVCGLGLTGPTGCARRPTAQFQAPAPNVAATGAPQLLFLSCRLAAPVPGSAAPRLQVLRAAAVPGQLKAPVADVTSPDFISIAQLSGQGKVLAQARTAHPLRPSVEYLTDDNRRLERRELTLPTAEFLVRLALHPAAKTIRVQETAAGQTVLLTELPVPVNP